MNSAIQRILVPLDPSEFTKATTHRACEAAKAHSAQIEGLAVVDVPGIRRDIAPADMIPWPVIYEAISRATHEAEDKIHEARNKFATACETQGVAHVEEEVKGVPSDLILDYAALFDLVVIGLRTFYHFQTRPEADGDSLAKILDRTVTPVLAVPAGDEKPLKRVLIAYDGSFGASRALRDFAAYAQPFDFEVTLFTADEDVARADAVQRHAAAYLRSHDLQNLEFAKTTKRPLAALENDHLKDADLIVAGIHSRRFFKDAFVGSFAKRLIEIGDTALFLSH